MLRCTSQDNPQDWPARLPSVLSAHRMTKHSSTGVSPNQAMLGRETLLLCTLIAAPPQVSPVATVHCDQFRNTIREAHSLARQLLHATAQTQKRCFDARVKPVVFHADQLVWLFWPRPLLRQKQRKLVNLWTGPWKILRFLSPISVVVQHVNCEHKQETDRARRSAHAVSFGDLQRGTRCA